MITIISFLVVIGIIIFIHELGHFGAAKLSGVRVEEFSLGFPPKMVGIKYGETEYRIGWIPLGGYVKMSGMLDEAFDEEYDPDDPRGFTSQSLLTKIFIITAGVIMNFMLGYFIYTGLTWHQGVARMVGTTITVVSPEYPAAKAGIKEGDTIFEVAGETVDDWLQMTQIIRANGGVPIVVKWMRNDSVFSAEITPQPTPDINMNTLETDTVGKLGVMGSIITEPVSLSNAFKYGAIEVWMVVNLSVRTVYALVTGRAKLKQLAGPIGIAKMSGEVAKSGLLAFLNFIALISISVGFLNILPIPMLDGGHLGFILIETVIRRPIPENVKMNLMRIGFAGLILLITLVSYHDIVRLFTN